jgi:hypothetical protein
MYQLYINILNILTMIYIMKDLNVYLMKIQDTFIILNINNLWVLCNLILKTLKTSLQK